jgi:4-amino-4-deoxy-L-arabinose transferase-like glycosyltransferase
MDALQPPTSRDTRPHSRRGWARRVPRGFLLLAATFFALATAWNLVIPPYENLDELEHAEVVRHIAVTGRLPVHGAAEAAGYRVRQEASQPPLYHILAAGWSRLLRLPAAPHDPEPVPGRVVACGPTGTFYNKATWRHDPLAAALPWSGAHLSLHGLRFFSALLHLATLAGVWTLARRVAPRGPLPLLTTALVAFNPQFLLLAAGVNNDNAVIPLATWGLVLACDLWQRGPTAARAVGMGLLAGLAALSKLSGLALVGLGGLGLLLYVIERKAPFFVLLRYGLAIVIPALVIVAPWMVRNWWLYNDPTALAPMLAEVGRREAPLAWGEARLMALSYWGQMPCSFYPRALYWPYLALMAGGLAGLVARWRALGRGMRRALALSGVWFAVIVGAWIRWNAMTPAPGGRLLFPAIGALALLLAVGWARRGGVAKLWAALLPVWALVVLVAGPMMLFLPPRFLPPSAPGAAAPGAAAPRAAAQALYFGEELVLHDYDAALRRSTGACLLASTAYCGPALDVTLTWEALAPTERDLTLVLQLVSPAPGETDLRLNYNHWPGRGNLPTSVWPVERRIRTHYLLPLSRWERETQAWNLRLALVDPASGARLPVTAGGTDGAHLGDAADLGMLRVPDAPAAAPDWHHPATPVTLAEAIVLRDAQVTPGAGGVWRVALVWESRAGVAADYVVFVHAYDAGGELLATGDGPPRNGAFPTSLWEPGDRVRTTHGLEVGAGAAPDRIAVGLYRPETGERAPAVQDGARLPHDAVVVWDATQDGSLP